MSATAEFRSAFVLGAGLGNRLRPLTAERPKPLVPVFHKPLITFAFDHLRASGVQRFVVNTHHCPEAYETLLGAKDARSEYAGCPILFRHESRLLDTGGGIGHVRDLIGDEPFLVHNGDVLADLPLSRLKRVHLAENHVATLLLRRSGGPLQVQWDETTGLVTDIRGRLGGRHEPGFLFTGIYALSPAVFPHLPGDEPVSIVPILLQMMQAGERVGGMVCGTEEDEGLWFDLGTRESYLAVHRRFFPVQANAGKLSYPLDRPWPIPVHPEAELGRDLTLEGASAVGPGARVGDGARLSDCIVWENAKIASRSNLETCIVRDGRSAEGELRGQDL